MSDEPILVPGFPAYRVFKSGIVESRWQSGYFYNGFPDNVIDRWRRPKMRLHDGGYLQIDMRDGRGNQRRAYVHHLVAELFIGQRPSSKHVIRHLDGNPANNDASNLAWGTYLENENDKRRHGTWGLRFGGAKLTDADVKKIRELRESGVGQKELAKQFMVSRPTITRICNNTIWRLFA